MSITSRILPKLPSLQTSIYERFVFDEKGLRAALLDIAANPTSSKTIRVVGLISIGRPLLLNSSHSGVHISGVGLRSGIVNGQSNTTLSSVIVATGNLNSFGLERLILGTDNRAVSANVTKILDFSGATFNFLSLVRCQITPATAGLDFRNGTGLDIDNCLIFASTTLNAVGAAQFNGGILGSIVATATDRLIISGAVFGGNVNTAAGNGATIVGNDLAGFTITSAGGDVVANNRP